MRRVVGRLLDGIEQLHGGPWLAQNPARSGRAQAAHDLGVRTFDDLLKTYRAGPDDLRTFVGPGPILTDDLPLVEYFLSLPRDRNVDLTALKGDVRDILDEN